MVPAEKILDTAVEKKADIVGLSGLITPSLDEMIARRPRNAAPRMSVPLLIGGATTSSKHTAVKIAPVITNRSFTFSTRPFRSPWWRTCSTGEKEAFVRKNVAAQDRDRRTFAERQQKALVPYVEALARRVKTDWAGRADRQAGVLAAAHVINPQPLAELVPYIDWSPFFQTWELRGKYPQIFDDPEVGPEARRLYDDARRLLEKIVEEKTLIAGASTGSGRPIRKVTTSSFMPMRAACVKSPASPCSASNGSARAQASFARWPITWPRTTVGGPITSAPLP